jgi:hypothetical protein
VFVAGSLHLIVMLYDHTWSQGSDWCKIMTEIGIAADFSETVVR